MESGIYSLNKHLLYVYLANTMSDNKNKTDQASNFIKLYSWGLKPGFRYATLKGRSNIPVGNYFKRKNNNPERENPSLVLRKAGSYMRGIQLNSAQLAREGCALQRCLLSHRRCRGVCLHLSKGSNSYLWFLVVLLKVWTLLQEPFYATNTQSNWYIGCASIYGTYKVLSFHYNKKQKINDEDAGE